MFKMYDADQAEDCGSKTEGASPIRSDNIRTRVDRQTNRLLTQTSSPGATDAIDDTQ